MLSFSNVLLASSQSSQYIKSVYSLPLTLDPIKMNDTASLVAGNLIYDGLLKFSSNLEIQTALAETWFTSSDGRILTFILKPNLKFHDGTLITSKDVVFSLKRAISKESKVRKYYDCIEGANEKTGSDESSHLGIKALNDSTIEIRLKHAMSSFSSILAGATAKILPSSLVNNKDFFNNPVGSGPFKFISKDEKSKKINLEAFPNYYRGKPKLERITLLETSESDAIYLAQSGVIHDLANWPLSKGNKIFQYGLNKSAPVASTWIIGLNTKSEALKSAKIRTSFKSSFDSESFRKSFYPDADSAFGYIPPGLTGYISVPTPLIKSNLKTSKKITIAIPDALASHKEIEKHIEESFKAKGWKVDVKPMAWKDLMKGYVNKTHDAFLVSMNMDYPDADFLLRNFETNNPDNFSGISHKELDSLILQFRVEPDRVKRAALYQKAINLLNNLSVTINLFHPRANYWLSPCVEGFEPNLLSDVYIDYTQVQLRPECMAKLGQR